MKLQHHRVGKAQRAHRWPSRGRHAEPAVGPARRVRPLAGPMAGSGRTGGLCPPCRLVATPEFA